MGPQTILQYIQTRWKIWNSLEVLDFELDILTKTLEVTIEEKVSVFSFWKKKDAG